MNQKAPSDNILTNFLRFEKTDILILNNWTQANKIGRIPKMIDRDRIKRYIKGKKLKQKKNR